MTIDRETNLVQALFSMGAGTVLTIIFGFMNISISARLLTEEQFGVYFLILTVVYLFQVVSSLGLRNAVVKFLASADQYPAQNIVSSLMTFELLVLAGVFVLTLLLKPLIVCLFPSDLLATLFLAVPIIFLSQTGEQLLDGVMQGFQLYHQMALVRVFNSIALFGLTVFFLLVLRWELEGLILATLLSQLFTIGVRVIMIPTRLSFGLDWSLLQRMVRFGLPLQGNDILTFISQRLDILIIGSMVNPEAVAYLAVATKIPQNFQRLFESLYSVYYPHSARLFGQGDRARAEVVLNRFLRLTAFITMSCALVVVLFQREIVLLVFSEKYLPSAPALGLLMVIFTLSVASTILDFTIIAADHPGYLPIISLADTVPSVIANLLLIPLAGFMGAVYAKLIANVTTNPVSVWSLRREKIAVKVWTYLTPLLIMLACLGVHSVLGWQSLSVKVALIMLFVGLCGVFGVIRLGDLISLVGTLPLRSRRPAFDK